MTNLSKTIKVYSDGSYKVELPSSFQLYQMKDDYAVWGKPRECAYGGCPGVMTLIDDADTEFTMDWQYYLIAINFGMQLNNIAHLMGYTKALMNRLGVFNPNDPRKNYITKEDLGSKVLPRIDKLRTFMLNTHSGTDDGTYVYLKTMNGNLPPPMKTNPATGLPYPYPQSISEIVPDHYLYLPQTHRHLFLDCNNVQWDQSTKSLDYGPFDNGIVIDWIGDKKPHSFFPFVSEKTEVKSLLRYWNKVSVFPSPFRSG